MRIDWIDIAFDLKDLYDYDEFNEACKKANISHQLTHHDYIGRIVNIQRVMVELNEKDPVVAYQSSHLVPSIGLGDTLEKIFKKVGIDRLAEKYELLTGKDCGCKRRIHEMNNMVPYGN